MLNEILLIMENKRLIGIVLTVVFLLLIPLLAMHFTDEVHWTLSDFFVMGILLLGTGLTCELVLRKVTKVRHRITLCAIILAVLLLIWVELAVGIFGTVFGGT